MAKMRVRSPRRGVTEDIQFRVVPPTTSRLTPRNAGLLDGVKSVRQPEPGLRRVTPLALATRLLGNSQYPKNSRVAVAVLLDRWFVCKQRIFLSCDVVKGVGYYRGIFMRYLYLNSWNLFSWNKNHEMHHKMQCDAETFVYDVTSQM